VPKFQRILAFLAGAAAEGRISLPDGQPRSLSEPETDQQNQDKRGQNEPRNHDDFDSHFANGRNIVVHVRIAVKESVTVAKNISAEQQIDDEEKCRGYSERGKGHWIDCRQHNFGLRLLSYLFLKLPESDISHISAGNPLDLGQAAMQFRGKAGKRKR
jgi:hypothetical protein